MRVSLPLVAFCGYVAARAGAQEAGSFRLTLINNGHHTITAAHSSPSKSGDWGDNLLTATLRPQQQVTLTVTGACGQYDVRFVAERGARLHDEDLPLCDRDTLTIGERTITETRAGTN